MAGKIGKKKCKILKEIRKAIADANDIEYVISECKFQGECRGTCPKCEAEVRYLEKELEKRRASGKSVALAGIATAMVISSGCNAIDEKTSTLKGDVCVSEVSQESVEASEESYVAEGLIYPPDYSEETETTEVEGKICPPDYSEETETTGDPLESPSEDATSNDNALVSDEYNYEILGEAYIPDEFFNSGDESSSK